MKKLFQTANFYMILGLVSGLFAREFTHINDFEGDTPLDTLHTHLLAMGMLFFLVVLALEKLFTLTESRLFKWFYLLYNGGLLLTVAVMTLRGTLAVLDASPTGGADTALAWTAGRILQNVLWFTEDGDTRIEDELAAVADALFV